MNCKICSKKTEATVPWKKYCSQACRQASWALKKVKACKRCGGIKTDMTRIFCAFCVLSHQTKNLKAVKNGKA